MKAIAWKFHGKETALFVQPMLAFPSPPHLSTISICWWRCKGMNWQEGKQPWSNYWQGKHPWSNKFQCWAEAVKHMLGGIKEVWTKLLCSWAPRDTMKKILQFLQIISGFIGIIGSQPKTWEKMHIGCQQRSTLGHTYVGKANTTVDGIPCQKWSDTEPHSHTFTHVGDHNFWSLRSTWP